MAILSTRISDRGIYQYEVQPGRWVSRQRLHQMRQRAKHDARSIVYKLIKTGVLFRQPCEVCNHEPAQAHHDDYLKPTEVRWLCRVHHNAHHKSLPKAIRPRATSKTRKASAVRIHLLRCRHCGHGWTPRKPVIYQCPKCKSPRWNEPKLAVGR